MTTIIATLCPRCGTPAAVYLTKRMMTQIMVLNVDGGAVREGAAPALRDADIIDAQEQQSGEVDDARQLHERMGHRWFDSRQGPGRCGCGEELDVIELLSHMVRHTAACHDDNNTEASD